MNDHHLPANVSILLLEDLQTDVQLITRAIHKKFPHALITVAPDGETYEQLISAHTFDVILSDFSLPTYSGIDALMLAKSTMPYVPFVFVTGTLNDEELVAQSILRGATGYVLKKNLNRLPTVIKKAIARKRVAWEKAQRKANMEEQEKHLLVRLNVIVSSVDFPKQDEMMSTINELLSRVMEKQY